jgi:hypothetical protein
MALPLTHRAHMANHHRQTGDLLRTQTPAPGPLGPIGTFNTLDGYVPRRLKVLWVENRLDCRTWGYYCDIRDAMARFHEICTPKSSGNCMDARGRKKAFRPDVAIIGPRYSINVMSEDESVGFDRARYPQLPLLVLQNKMYVPNGWREIVGNLSGKLDWVRAAGASAAFTWLTSYQEFSERSGVPHHWLPFGVDSSKFGPAAGSFGPDLQPFDVGFTGASGVDKYPLRAAVLRELKSMPIRVFTGTWSQTTLDRRNNDSWKAAEHSEYARQMARSKMWVSTTGPRDIVGTRYFEVLASGTTLLLCNRPAANRHVYSGLFEDGVHAVFFDGVADLRAKVQRYLSDEQGRRQIVHNARELVQAVHTWDARAKFLTKVAEAAITKQAVAPQPLYIPPITTRAPKAFRFRGCFAAPSKLPAELQPPPPFTQ